MFIWKEDDLNPQQQEAVLLQESTLLVACPGSGKTRTLTYKIAYELTRLISEKQHIIAITYTNAAAEEIKERVELLGVDISQLWIGTIHAFCTEWILRPYYLYMEELRYGFKIINAHDSDELIDGYCREMQIRNFSGYDCDFYATKDGYRLACPDEWKHPHIEEVLKRYFEHLRQNRQIDYEMILYYSCQLLEKKPAIREVLTKIFPIVLIDEYQDTKEIQYDIIFSIIKAGAGATRLFIVGDPNQSIFQTLGGFPMPKDQMQQLTGLALTERHLENNYRSSGKIIDYFDYYKTYPNTIIPAGSDAPFASLISYNSTVSHEQLEEEIARLITLNIHNGIAPNEICIAGPQWIPLAALTRGLMARLPDYSFDGPGMAPFARDHDNFWFKLSRILLTEPSPLMYIRRMRWAKEVLSELDHLGVDVTSHSPRSLLRMCNSLAIESTDGLDYLRIGFASLMEQLSVDIHVFPLLEEHHLSFFSSSEARIARLRERNIEGIGSIENFRKVFRQRDGIKISTIHGIKGTEYDTVIGFGLLHRWVPYHSDANGDENSKKMLYVLASRARKHLHIISETERQVNWRNPNGLQPTQHLIEYEYAYDQT